MALFFRPGIPPARLRKISHRQMGRKSEARGLGTFPQLPGALRLLRGGRGFPPSKAFPAPVKGLLRTLGDNP